MESRRIGALDVSVVGLGCNQLGTPYCDLETSKQIVTEALDSGVTYFDTADEYGLNYADPHSNDGWGRSEEHLGAALRGRRDEAVIGSKFGIKPHGGVEGGGASARYVAKAVEDSLRRLGTDRIDLYQLHVEDPSVPIEETLGALQELLRQGKVREIGCCNFSPASLEEARGTAEKAGLRPFASLQSALNLLQRQALPELLPTCDRLQMAFIPYYPLASGMLTGKYRRGEDRPTGTRLTDQLGADAQARVFSERAFARVEALEAYAAERGRTLLELAIGWLLGQPAVATVIAGAARPGQVRANSEASDWVLSPDEVAEATAVVAQAAG
jgi:aryl-alcohol dehydrogenase-like predicted oxidoreductase